jgi:hypothetical protein
MANLVQVAEELEYVPKDQLIQMSQNPDSRYPQYLVLSEIQRRTQMEKMYRAQEASMNQPQTTVAEEVVADFAEPQGLAGMNAEGPANAGDFSPPAMPATPMQMAASGGRTGYQNTGTTSISDGTTTYSTYSGPNARLQLLESLGIDPTGMSEEEIQKALQFAVSVPIEQEQLPTVDTGVNQPVDLTEVSSPRVPSVDTPEEDSWLDKAGSWAKDRYTDEGEGLGAVDWSRVLMDASWAIPGTAAVKGLGYAGKLGLGAAKAKWGSGAIQQGVKNVPSRVKQGLMGSVTKPNPKVVQGPGFSMRDPSIPARLPSATRIGLTTTGLASANMTHNYLSDDEVIKSKEKEKEIVETTQDKLNKLLADINKTQDTGTTEKKGLASFLPQAEGLDIAQLGGIIMGARNMSELGAGIAGLAGSIQDRRTKEKLTDIQGGLFKAQTAKYEADVEMMEPNQLIEVMKNLEDMLKLEMEQVGGESDRTLQLHAQYEAAYKRYAELMGIPFTTEAERMQEALKEASI